MFIPKHKAKVENGKLILKDKERFSGWIVTLDGDVEVIVQKPKTTRTSKQNSFYWAYISLVSDETGDDPNSLHEYFKRTHLPPRFITVMGKDIKIPATTTKLSKKQFSDYIRSIEVETGIMAPSLEDLYG